MKNALTQSKWFENTSNFINMCISRYDFPSYLENDFSTVLETCKSIDNELISKSDVDEIAKNFASTLNNEFGWKSSTIDVVVNYDNDKLDEFDFHTKRLRELYFCFCYAIACFYFDQFHDDSIWVRPFGLYYGDLVYEYSFA